jgi:hypothetical protein
MIAAANARGHAEDRASFAEKCLGAWKNDSVASKQIATKAFTV